MTKTNTNIPVRWIIIRNTKKRVKELRETIAQGNATMAAIYGASLTRWENVLNALNAMTDEEYSRRFVFGTETFSDLFTAKG